MRSGAPGIAILGTMTFGDQVELKEAQEMVDLAREAGINSFDTSNNYAGGESERILGRAISAFRDEVIISTKGGSPVGQNKAELSGLSPRALRSSVEGSLRRLNVEVIDVYYLHRPDPNVPIEETLESMAQLISEGKIRALGQSNFAAWQITEMNLLARTHGWPGALISQQVYNLLARRIESEYLACANHFGLTTIAYNPLAGGLLTGKHGLSTTPTPGSRFTKDIYRARYWSEELFNATGELAAIARSAGMSLVDLSFAWLRGRKEIAAVLVGASSVSQLRENLRSVKLGQLAPEIDARCDEVWAKIAGAAPPYNR